LKKILIYRTCSLGDFINTAPAIKLLKKKYPNSLFYFVCQKRRSVGYVYPNLLPFKKKIIDKYIFFENNFLGIGKLFYKLKNLKLDLIYNFNEFSTLYRAKRDFIFFKSTGARKLIGFKNKDFNYKNNNETYHLCKIVKKNIKKSEISFSGIFEKVSKTNKKYITISMGGRNPEKSWNNRNWKSLVQIIVKKFPNLKIKLVGTINDIDNANNITKISKNYITNMCGKTSVKSLFKLINLSAYHISHDDGTMHVASTFNKPGAVIFGLTSHKGKWKPMNNKLRIFYPKKNINETKPDDVFKRIFIDLKKIK